MKPAEATRCFHLGAFPNGPEIQSRLPDRSIASIHDVLEFVSAFNVRRGLGPIYHRLMLFLKPFSVTPPLPQTPSRTHEIGSLTPSGQPGTLRQ
jgi:hypothetical protein